MAGIVCVWVLGIGVFAVCGLVSGLVSLQKLWAKTAPKSA